MSRVRRPCGWLSTLMCGLLMLMCALCINGEDIDDVMRQEALSKLPKPLEDMKAKELQCLLKERGERTNRQSEPFRLHVAFADDVPGSDDQRTHQLSLQAQSCMMQQHVQELAD